MNNQSIQIVTESTPLIKGQSSQSHAQANPAQKKKELMGLLLMTLSALGFSTMSLLVKISGTHYPSFEIVFARSIVQTILGILACVILKVSPLGPRGIRGWLFFRGLSGTIGLSLFYYSITKLPLADATVVFFLGPAFTAILAALALGEAFTLFDGFCAVLCLVGVLLVSKPDFIFSGNSVPQSDPVIRMFAICCALVGAMMSAVAYVTVRKLGGKVHFMVHVVYFGLVSIVLSPVCMFLLQTPVVPKSLYDYFIFLCVGLTAFVGQCFLNQGLQLAPAGPGTLMRMNDVVFAFLFEIFILNDIPDIYSVSGACIIVSMTSAMCIHKLNMHRKSK